ncbi:transposase [Micromonospora olivasterospora]|uniref:transposase n=1 Tax=Micromonospora olivasterospora TaxID=1880 RepID=UPI001B871BF2|nr:transposase [Micromonospora olivasterospora]
MANGNPDKNGPRWGPFLPYLSASFGSECGPKGKHVLISRRRSGPLACRTHFLPGYAPELNPMELLNSDIKRHVAQANPANPAELAAAAAAHLRRRQNQPEAVKAFSQYAQRVPTASRAR